MYRINQTYLKVDLLDIKENAESLKVYTNGKLIAVVKADAYGHGVIPVAETLASVVDMFAVATVEEAIELRQADISKPILILYSPLPEYTEQILTHDLTPAIDNWDLALELNTCYDKKDISDKNTPNGKVRIHVDVNTGMNRSGVCYTEAREFIQRLRTLPNIEVEGIFTHFANAEAEDKSFAHIQLNRFYPLLAHGPRIPIVHAANSAAILEIPESRFNALRPGLSLYGIYPGKKRKLPLCPALTWVTHVHWLGEIAAGEGVSYGLEYTAKRRTRIAGLRVGFGDGYPRALSGIGEVLINGKRRPILGRICMDSMVVKLTKSDNVRVGSQVVLLGKQAEQEISIEEIAEKAGTIPYEILTRIGKRVKRVYSELDWLP